MRLFIALIALAAVSIAHLDTGVDQQVGQYLLDVGWEPAEPAAGEPVFFAVNIVDGETGEPTGFDKAWVRLSKGDRIAFAGTLGMDNGSAGFSYMFPEAGEYEMDVRFGDETGTVAVPVGGARDEGGAGWIAAGVAGAVALILAFMLIARAKA